MFYRYRITSGCKRWRRLSELGRHLVLSLLGSAFAGRTWAWGKILGTVNLHLQARGVRITTGTIVDATILHAPASTKNREQQRDPEMHQTKKGNQWYFGMKAHVGVDSKTKIIHTAVATAANVADSTVLADLLHGEETRVWGDQAYRGQTELIRECAPLAQDHTHRRYRYKNGIDEQERAKNRTKSSVRSKVEHPFQVSSSPEDPHTCPER